MSRIACFTNKNSFRHLNLIVRWSFRNESFNVLLLDDLWRFAFNTLRLSPITEMIRAIRICSGSESLFVYLICLLYCFISSFDCIWQLNGRQKCRWYAYKTATKQNRRHYRSALFRVFCRMDFCHCNHVHSFRITVFDEWFIQNDEMAYRNGVCIS